MDRYHKFVSGLFQAVSAGFLVIVMVVVVLQVFFRYVAQIVVPWTEEASRYLCIWMVFTGAVFGIAEDSHIKVTFLQDKAAPVLRHLIVLFSYLVMALLNSIILAGSLRLILQNWRQLAVTFPVSVAALYAVLTLFSAVSLPLIVYLFWMRAAELRRGENSLSNGGRERKA